LSDLPLDQSPCSTSLRCAISSQIIYCGCLIWAPTRFYQPRQRCCIHIVHGVNLHPIVQQKLHRTQCTVLRGSGERRPLVLIEVIFCCPILKEINMELGTVTHCSIVNERPFEWSSQIVYPFVFECCLCILKKCHNVFIKAYLFDTF